MVAWRPSRRVLGRGHAWLFGRSLIIILAPMLILQAVVTAGQAVQHPQRDTGVVGVLRGKKGNPVAIGHLERFVADWIPERIEYELGVIIQMGFPGYFLVTADLIQHAKSVGIRCGPGRGSAAGSIGCVND